MSIPNAKWFPAITPDQRVTDVARPALLARLEVVWHWLPLAAQAPEEDVEYVHQLRVSSRRATAALDAFSELLPQRKGRWLRKWLRRSRRAAGPARDDDVLAARLARRAASDSSSDVAQLLAEVQAHRQQAQQPIVELFAKTQKKRVPQRAAQRVSKLRWRGDEPEPTFHQFARTALADEVAAFQQAAAVDLHDPEALHQLRIAGKRLRYAMEIFAGAFPPEFREVLYPQVEHLQELLGQVNDHAVGQARFERWFDAEQKSKSSAARILEPMIAEERAAFADSQQAFHQWWHDAHGAQLLHAFAPYLAAADEAT